MTTPPTSPRDLPRPEGDPVDDHLVAYLDGELAAEHQSQLEDRLSSDSVQRHALRQLQQTWDLLDDLPRVDADDVFARSTVEMVACSIEQTEASRGGPLQRGRQLRWLLAAVLVLAAASAGFLATWNTTRRDDRRLLADLPLIENFDALRSAGSLAFLTSLHQASLFAPPLPTDDPSVMQSTASTAQAGASPGNVALPMVVPWQELDKRRLRLERLSAQDKLALQLRRRRFESAPPEQRRLARETYEQLVGHEQRNELWPLLLQYHLWLEALPASEREPLLQLPDKQRLSEVTSLVRQQEARRFQELIRTPLLPADADAIFQWLDAYVQRHETEILAALPPQAAQRIRAAERPDAQRLMLLAALWRLWPTGQFPQPTDNDLQQLLSRLSPTARATIDDLKRPRDRVLLAQRWIGAALSSRARPLVSPEELRRFFALELTPDERTYLETLPPEEMRRELLQIYLRSRREPPDSR
jgi:muconolactone delta-isomerase